jgi:hypothetical protein
MTVVDERIPVVASETTFLSALAALQAEVPKLPKDKTNPHFGSKFTGLDTIVETVGPLLVKHRLVWITMPGRDEIGPYLEYRLVHLDADDGGLFGRIPLVLAKDDMQGLGSALTYARRYALSSVLNLVADEDDDGRAASSSRSAQPTPTTQPPGTQNLQPYGKGISNPGLIAAWQAAGIRLPEGSIWMALSRVPEGQAQALYAALQDAKNAEDRR